MKEEIYYVVDSLGVSHEEVIERPAMSIARLFVEGGAGYMTVISIFLILLLVAAWKDPMWVKEIGIAALVVGVFATLLGLVQIFDSVQLFGDEVTFPILCGGLKVAFIAVLYGLIVYFISLVFRVVQKPRI